MYLGEDRLVLTNEAKSRIFFGRIAIWNCRRISFFLFFNVNIQRTSQWSVESFRIRKDRGYERKKEKIKELRPELANDSASECEISKIVGGNREISCRSTRNCIKIKKNCRQWDRACVTILGSECCTTARTVRQRLLELSKFQKHASREDGTERKRRTEEAKCDGRKNRKQRQSKGIVGELREFPKIRNNERAQDKRLVDRSIEELPIFLHPDRQFH